MKKLRLFTFLILSIVLISCSDKEKNQTENKPDADSKSVAENKDYNGKQNITDKSKTGIEIASATFQEKIDNGEVLLLTTEGEPEPYEFSSNKIMTIQMPDGKLHQVEMDGDKTWISVPGKGKMQVIRLNGKVYLFDDDNQAYEVKVINKELVAEVTSITDEILAIDK